MARSMEVFQFLLGLKADRQAILHGILDGSKGYNDDDLRRLALIQQAIAAVEAETADTAK